MWVLSQYLLLNGIHSNGRASLEASRDTGMDASLPRAIVRAWGAGLLRPYTIETVDRFETKTVGPRERCLSKEQL
jgi:hypothetical protein